MNLSRYRDLSATSQPREQHIFLLLSLLAALQVRLCPFPGWFRWLLGSRCPRGMYTPWGTVYVQALKAPAKDIEDVRELLPLLAHEGRHAYEARLYIPWWPRLSPWIWVLAYLISPFFRRVAESSAEAYETAVRGFLAGSDPAPRALRRHVRAATLGGWHWPHFTGGDPDLLKDAVADMASTVFPAIFPPCTQCGGPDDARIFLNGKHICPKKEQSDA